MEIKLIIVVGLLCLNAFVLSRHTKRTSNDKQCGLIEIAHRFDITNSSDTINGEFPWQAVLYKISRNNIKSTLCGGSLLNENTILTAAHCVNGIHSPESVSVVLGKHNLEFRTIHNQEHYVKQIIQHDLYDPEIYHNDIAILKLAAKVNYTNYIQPICITPSYQIFDNIQMGKFPNWGRTRNELTKSFLSVQNKEECIKENPNFFTGSAVNDNSFCVKQGNSSMVYNGDSGGALVFEFDGHWYIRGVASIQMRMNSIGIGDRVIFTDVVKSHQWISSRM